MTMRFMVLGRYPLDLDECALLGSLRSAFEGAPKKDIERRNYFQFLRKTSSTNDVLLEAMALERVCQIIGRADSVSEFFGGIGVSGSIISARLRPKKHLIADLDAECVANLHRQYPRAQIYKMDSLLNWRQLSGAQFCLLDFNSFSLLHLNRPSGLALLGLCASRAPRWIAYCDTACCKLRLNHAAYTKSLGTKIEVLDDYVAASARHWRKYGWSIKAWLDYGNSALVLIKRGDGVMPPVERLKLDGARLSTVR